MGTLPSSTLTTGSPRLGSRRDQNCPISESLSPGRPWAVPPSQDQPDQATGWAHTLYEAYI